MMSALPARPMIPTSSAATALTIQLRRSIIGLPTVRWVWGIPLTGNGNSARGPALSGGWPAL